MLMLLVQLLLQQLLQALQRQQQLQQAACLVFHARSCCGDRPQPLVPLRPVPLCLVPLRPVPLRPVQQSACAFGQVLALVLLLPQELLQLAFVQPGMGQHQMWLLGRCLVQRCCGGCSPSVPSHWLLMQRKS
jgi:hypothetical protein